MEILIFYQKKESLINKETRLSLHKSPNTLHIILHTYLVEFDIYFILFNGFIDKLEL